MFPSQSLSRKGLLVLIGVGLLQARAVTAATCQSDPHCLAAIQSAEAARTSAERAVAIKNLQAAYRRHHEPRLLGSLGRLHLQQEEPERAREVCRDAQAQAHGDSYLQERALACISEATQALEQQQKLTAGPKSSRSRAEAVSRATVDVRIVTEPQGVVAAGKPPACETTPTDRPTGRPPIWKRPGLWLGIGAGIGAVVIVGLAAGLGPRKWLPEPGTPEYQL